jgi:diguanylate cyclase (GGDEF)-like protein/PAS domain S-box-containing protein
MRQTTRAAKYRRLSAWSSYLAGEACLTTAYMVGHFVGPRWLNSGPVFNLIGGSAVVALILGARKNLPNRRLPWYLFALAQSFFVTGDVLAYNYVRIFGSALPFPSIADPFYLTVYPLLIAGGVLLIRRRNEIRSRASLIDTMIITVGAGTLSWIYLMAPYAHDPKLTLATKLTAIAYPLGDITLLGVFIRLGVGARRRGAASGFLLAGTAMVLITDSLYGWKLLHGGYSTGGILDVGWAAFYALLGAAALHPSMRQLAEPARDPGDFLSRYRLALLTGATLTAPILLLSRGSLIASADGYVLVAASMILFALVLLRMSGLVRRNEEATRTQAALRMAGEELVTASSRDEIYSAALRAARSVLGEDVVTRLYIATGGDDRLVAVSASDTHAADLPPLACDELPARSRTDFAARRVVTLVRPTGTVSVAALMMRGEIGGVLCAHSAGRLRRSAEESFATLAAEVALALQSATLTEESLNRRSEARLGSLVQNASDVICIVGEDDIVRYASPSVQRMFGYLPSAVLGGLFTDIVHPDEQQRVVAFIAATAGRPLGHPEKADFRIRHEERGWLDVEALGTNLLEDETVNGIVLNIRDMSERRTFEAELEHQAFHDSLTGLPNRALLHNRLEHALAGARRATAPVALLFLDVDGLKDINDTLGHASGDKVLQEIGRRLDECVRGTDTAARIGGDEFGVMIQGPESGMRSIEIAERVTSALTFALTLDGKQVSIATSMGIAFSGTEGSGALNADELLRDADAAMYMAKQSGNATYQVFRPDMHATALARLELKGDLQRAMDAHEFTLRYQPIMDLSGGDMAGMEALVRWEHPVRGILSPVEFIPLVEETGLIVSLGLHVLREACRQAVVLQRACPRDPPLVISVNISGVQLQRAEFIDEVRSVLEETEIQPSSLALELTESVMMKDMDLSISRMKALRSLGVKLAIDDFGSGYSSLMYLRRLPVDILKVDRSFLADTSLEGTHLLIAVVELARIFKLHTVVEGVEDETYLTRLKDTHCAYGQGYYFAKPLPGDEIMAFAAHHSRAAEPSIPTTR